MLVRSALAVVLALAAITVRAQCPTSRGDLAPGTLDASTTPPTWRVGGDGRIDVSDVVVALRQAVGLQDVAWPAPGATCAGLPGDVAPGTRIGATTPPLWTALGDGRRDLGDVIV